MQSDHLHFLLPFALPPAEDATAIFSSWPAFEGSALKKLLARATQGATPGESAAGTDFQRTLPHERWAAQAFGAITAQAEDDTPLAPYMLLADGGDPGDAVWACIEPVHVRIARDHLVLIDPGELALPDADAAVLLAIARPLIEELGVRLVAPLPVRWYVSSPTLGALATASPLRAAGRNIEIWLPRDAAGGPRSRTWLQLQNEVQMAWFEHPLNLAREARGLASANSIWLHAQGARQPLRKPFARVFSRSPALRGLGLASGARTGAPPADLAALAGAAAFDSDNVLGKAGAANDAVDELPTLIEIDTLTTPFIQQDWHGWLAALDALERDWLAPALEALKSGAVRRLALTLCADTAFTTLTTTRADLRKFWRRGSLADLLVA
jgi:hypothetical protein